MKMYPPGNMNPQEYMMWMQAMQSKLKVFIPFRKAAGNVPGKEYDVPSVLPWVWLSSSAVPLPSWNVPDDGR